MSQARAAKPPVLTVDGLTVDGLAGRQPAGRRGHTRQALLDAAAALFAERGYHETGVPDIVRAAGVSQGTFYHYFSHRRDVLMALTQVAHAAASERPTPRGPGFGDLLKVEIDWYLVECVRNTNLAKIWHDAAAYDRDIACMMRTGRIKRVAEFAAVIAKIKTAKGLDPEVAAYAIIGMIEEFTYRWVVEGERGQADVATASDTLCAMIMRSLGMETPPGA
jgi:AcrR family transcriptional regulator